MHQYDFTDPRWGRVNFGSHPRKPALPIALAGGSLVAAALALCCSLLAPQHPHLWQNLVNFWIPALPASIASLWLGIVDRKTLPNAVTHPERSIEQTWAHKAVKTAFYGSIIIESLALFVCAFFDLSAYTLPLLILLVVQGLLVSAAYLYHSRRD